MAARKILRVIKRCLQSLQGNVFYCLNLIFPSIAMSGLIGLLDGKRLANLKPVDALSVG